MQMVKCPFCFVFLDVSHLPANYLIACPGCGKPVRVKHRQVRHYVLSGAALGVMVGVAATLGLGWVLRPLPVNVAAVTPSVPGPSSPVVEENPVEEKILDVYGRSASDATAKLRQEFGDGTFAFLEARPWLVALEYGRYPERQTIQLYERGLRSLYLEFMSKFESLRLPEPARVLPVVIFNSRESFDTYCRRRYGRTLPATVMGLFEPTRQRTVSYHEGYCPVERLLHEGTHQLVHHYSIAPFESFWFHEGLGSMFETYQKGTEGAFEVVIAKPDVNRPRLYEALAALNDPEVRSAVRLSQIMSLSMDSFRDWWDRVSLDAARELRRDEAARLEANRDKLANAYYAVSWAVVYYMMHSDPAFSDVLKEYFFQETRGKGGRDTFELILKGRVRMDLDEFEAGFLHYLENLK